MHTRLRLQRRPCLDRKRERVEVHIVNDDLAHVLNMNVVQRFRFLPFPVVFTAALALVLAFGDGFFSGATSKRSAHMSSFSY